MADDIQNKLEEIGFLSCAGVGTTPIDTTKYVLQIVQERRKPKVCEHEGSSCWKCKPLEIPKSAVYTSKNKIDTGLKWFTLVATTGKSYKFPMQSSLPKVIVAHMVPIGQLPRGVAEDRQRKQNSLIDIVEELKADGITFDDLLPTKQQFFNEADTNLKHFLPLTFFDNYDYDTNSPEAWLSLGVMGREIYALPAKAFLPDKSGKAYNWQIAAVVAYSDEEDMWYVKCLDTEKLYYLSKCHVLFFAENTEIFLKRLKDAIKLRNLAEFKIKVDSIVDCVLLQHIQSNMLTFPFKGIRKLLKKYEKKSSFHTFISREVYVLFEQIMAYYELDSFIQISPKEFADISHEMFKEIIPKSSQFKYETTWTYKPKKNHISFVRKKVEIFRHTLYYIKAGIEAMKRVKTECLYVESLSLFICDIDQPTNLDEFLLNQNNQSEMVASYLKEAWPFNLSTSISNILLANGKGWLDVNLKKWSVYKMSKIIRFILQVKYRMESSMQELLTKSIVNFSDFLSKPCLAFLRLRENFVWPKDDYINTRFPYSKPIFALEIKIDAKQGVYYSTAPEEFQVVLSKIFRKNVEKTGDIRCINAKTLKKLRFSPNLYILTVELIDQLYVKHSKRLKILYKKAVIPIKAYAKLYERFIDICTLHVFSFMKDYEEQGRSSLEVKNDILEFKRQKSEIRKILPANIIIGPFFINVDPIKQYMIKKLTELVKHIFEYYVQRMYDINLDLLKKCNEMFKTIDDRPTSIEHLYAIREFGENIPKTVIDLKSEIQVMFIEYELLDSFFYNINDVQFEMKWQTFAMPHKLLKRLSYLREEQKIDFEEFKRVHSSECIEFEERLERLNDDIQTFSLQFDPKKALESGVEVKKISNVIAEYQTHGETLKNRQKLFELGEYSLEFLNNLIISFEPYRALWTTIVEFLKLEEASIGNPLHQVDIPEVWRQLETKRKALQKSYHIFEEKPELQNVARIYLEKIKKFKAVLDCMKCFKNENWLGLHWQQLVALSGLDIKYSSATNFSYLIRKGIMQFVDLIKEIETKAINEAEYIKNAFLEEERLKEERRLEIIMRKARRKCRNDIC